MEVIASSRGGFALVATALGAAEGRRRAFARRQAALSRSRTLCEDLAERLGWLQHPDDRASLEEVIEVIRDEAAALEVCIGRLSGPVDDTPRPAAEELAALVDAVDAEVRLGVLGDPAARSRARHLASCLRAGAAGLLRDGTACRRPRVLSNADRGDDRLHGRI